MRLFIIEEDLPVPGADGARRGASGLDYVADLGWPELRTIGEFDGRRKYDASGPMGPGHPLWQEKVREDDIRAAGWQVVRVVTEDFTDRPALRARFVAAFGRAATPPDAPLRASDRVFTREKASSSVVFRA